MNVIRAALTAPIRLRRYIWALLLCWTAVIVATLAWEISDEYDQAVDIAISEARGAWQRDAAILCWGAEMDGLYAPRTTAAPDPQLAKLPDRDVTTEAGRKLTLINPVAMLRDIRETTQKNYGVRGHVTSLRPLDPRNAPDAWEREALEAIAVGQTEVHALATVDGEQYLRFMRPLAVDQTCLKCHAEQGYAAGDIRGGISVTVPMSAAWPARTSQILHRVVGYGGMWLLGVVGLLSLARQLGRQVARRYTAEQQLQEINAQLDERVTQRTAELAVVNKELAAEIAERKQAERWLLESEERFRGYFEQGLVGMAILSPHREWIEVNPRFCSLVGYPEDELLKKTWADLTHPDDQAAEEEQFRQMFAGEMRGFHLTKRVVRKDGAARAVSLSVQCLRRGDGAVDCVLVLMHER